VVKKSSQVIDRREFARLLADKRLTQQEAADRLGVHRRTVLRWLHGHTPISEAVSLLIRAKIG
jgi:transcriptional regulator with XRE-family HTH domain